MKSPGVSEPELRRDANLKTGKTDSLMEFNPSQRQQILRNYSQIPAPKNASPLSMSSERGVIVNQNTNYQKLSVEPALASVNESIETRNQSSDTFLRNSRERSSNTMISGIQCISPPSYDD